MQDLNQHAARSYRKFYRAVVSSSLQGIALRVGNTLDVITRVVSGVGGGGGRGVCGTVKNRMTCYWGVRENKNWFLNFALLLHHLAVTVGWLVGWLVRLFEATDAQMGFK